jgi:hypothetical protein
MLVPTIGALEAWIADLGADTTWLGSASVGLYTNAVAPTLNTTLANLNEANYDGYARQAAHTFSSVFIDGNGLVTIEAESSIFSPTDTVTANTIYGLFLTGHDSTKLLAVEPFDTPIPLVGPLSSITIIPRVGLQPTAPWGFSVVAP